MNTLQQFYSIQNFQKIFVLIIVLNITNQIIAHGIDSHTYCISSIPDAYTYTLESASLMTCDDGIQNGDETGIDCGGTMCAPCCTPSDEFSLNFDGIDNDIQDLDNIGMGTEFTVEFWINPGSSQSQYAQPIGYTHTSPANSWTLQANGNSDTNWRFAAAHGSSFYFVYFDLTSNVWQHVALTLDATSMKVFIDGVEVGSTARTQDISYVGDEVLDIGGHSTLSRFFTGQLDEIRIWDYARSDGQIFQSHNESVYSTSPGLLVYYECDDLLDGILVDATANGYDGTLNNFTLPDDIYCGVALDEPCVNQDNYALDFDGVDEYVDISTIPSSNLYSYEFWFNTDDLTSDRRLLGSDLVTSNHIRIHDSKLQYWDEINIAWYDISGVLNSNTWYHIAISKNSATEITTYLDGVFQFTHTIPSATTFADQEIADFYSTTHGSHFNGKIDEFRVWDGPLLESDINARKDIELNGNETNLIAYYNFNDGIGTTLLDKTSNGYNGTLTNMEGNTDWVCSLAFSSTATCTDGIQNGDETGVDCGGSCDPCPAQNSLHFVGSTSTSLKDYIETAGPVLPLTATGEVTMESWVKIDSNTSGSGVLAQYEFPGDDNRFTLQINASKKLTYWKGGIVYMTSTSDIADDTWHHYAITKSSAGDLKMYIDGVLEDNGTDTTGFGNFTFRIGHLHTNNSPTGAYDEVRLWNTVRTETQINDYKDTELTGNEADLELYYNFNHGVAGGDNGSGCPGGTPCVDMVTDLTGNHNATLYDFSLAGNTSNWIPGALVECSTCDCIAPSALVVENINDVSADLTWTPGGDCVIDAEYWVIPSSDPSPTIGTGTVLACVPTFPIQHTGLTAGVTYRVYVYEDCDTSGTVGPINLGEFMTCPATREWTGAADSLWSNPDNWCRGAIPDNGDNVLIPAEAAHDVFVDTNVMVQDLEFRKHLTINASDTLTVDGALKYYADLTNHGYYQAKYFSHSPNNDPSYSYPFTANRNFLNTSTATMIIDGQGAERNALYLYDSDFTNDGILEIRNFPRPFGYSGTTNTGITISSSGIFTNNGTIEIENFTSPYSNNHTSARGIAVGSGCTFNNHGPITIDVQYDDIRNDGTFDNTNIITVEGGEGIYSTAASPTFINTGSILMLNGDDPISQSVAAWTNDGTLQGKGLITGDMTNSGILIPGESPGVITYDDVFSNTGEIEFEVDGLNGPGVVGGHDQLVLNASGNTLGGTITVTSTYTADPSDQIVLISAPNGYSGTFATTNLPPNESGSSWVISYEATEVILSLGPLCYAPSDLTIDNLGENNVDITWTPGGNCTMDGTYWVQPIADPAPTAGVGGTTFTCGGTFPIAVTGLTAGQTYNVYVYEVCGTGIDVGPELVGTFTTWVDCDPDGKFGLDFDGVNDYVDISTVTGDNSTSIECWINAASTSGENRIVSRSSALQNIYSVAIIDGYLHFYVNGWVQISDVEILANEWNHIALSRIDSTQLQTYHNGVLKSTITVLPSQEFKQQHIGASPSSDYFPGKIDEFRVWDGPLAEADIIARINSELTGAEANLLAYFPLNEGVGNTQVLDLSPNAHVGTLTNMDANSDWVCGFEPIPCLQPSGLSTSNVSGSSATANWVTNGNTDFEVIIGASGFEIGNEDMSFNVTGSSHIFTGLAENVAYDWYVRADCDADGYSGYSGPESFTILNTTLLFSDNAEFVTHMVSPQTGIPEDTYRFEVIYENVVGDLPTPLFPRVLLDQDNNGTPELSITMTAMDTTDTDVTDGKYYFAEIAGLQPDTNYVITIEDIKPSGEHTILGPLNQPDVLLNPNLQLFASDISFSESNPDVDEFFIVYAEIHNNGSFDLNNVEVELYNQMTESSEGTVTVSLIPAGESANVFWDVQAADDDAWVPYKVTIDPADNIVESNELDNDAVKAVIVGDFTLPIDIDFLSGPSISPFSGAVFQTRTLVGNAVYTGLNGTTQDTTVKGAQIILTIDDSEESFSGFTNNQGDFSIPINTTLGVGTYSCTGVITDETITEIFTVSFQVTAPPPGCTLPDLVLEHTKSSSVVNIGDLLTGTFTVSNLGCSATTETVSLVASFPGASSPVGPWEILPLDVGQDTTVSWSTSYPSVANVSFSAHVDDESEEVEIDEGNNYTSGTASVASKSNLKVPTCTDVTLSPNNPVPGSTATISFLIKNNALLALEDAYDVDLVVAGTTYSETFVDDIPAGGSYFVNMDFIVPAYGDNEMSISLDPNDDIEETDETDNIYLDKLCREFSLTKACGSPGGIAFWETTHAVNQIIDLSIGVHNNGHYDAAGVDVTFEVMGPGYPSWTLIDTETLNFSGKTCGCPIKATSSVPFAFVTEGSYQIRMTADSNDDFIECDETNNEMIVNVEVANIPDLRTISTYINPSELNPDIDEQISFVVTYENLGDENLGDEFDLQISVDDVIVETINVDGLITNGQASIAFTNPWSSSVLGGHIIKAFVDSGEEITEVSESNNEATRAIIVGTAPNLKFASYSVSDTVPGIGDEVLIQSLIENQGDISCSANLEVFYLDYNGTEVLIQSLPITVGATSSSQYSVSYTVDRNEVYLIARITPGTPDEYNLLDNEAELLLKTGEQVCNLIVKNTNDSGQGSLRQCIECANSGDNPSKFISFDIPGGGPYVINLLSSLPILTADSVTVDGTTQTGNFPMAGNVIIDITAIPDYSKLVWIIHGENSSVFGLNFQNFDLTSVSTGLFYATGADSLVIGGKDRGNWFSEDKWTSCIFLKENINKGVIQSNVFQSDSLRLKFGITINSGSNKILVGGDSSYHANKFYNFTGNAVELRNGSNNNRILNNTFVENTKGIFNNGDLNGSGGQNNGNWYLGNTFICNTEGIVHNPNANQNKLPPSITYSKVNYIAGIGDPGNILEVYVSPDTCAVADCQGETILVRDTLPADGVFQILLPANQQLNLGDKISAIQTDTLFEGSSKFVSCEIADDDCVDFVYTCDDNIVGSLRSAIDCAIDGDTIYFLNYLMDDLIQITDGICINKNLVIEGLGNPGLTLLSNADDFVFKIDANKTVTIKELILCSNDTSANQIFDNSGDLTLDNITINDKRTGAAQTIVLNNTGANLTVKNVVELLKD